MNQPNNNAESDLTHLNYYRIRRIIGTLGILLPILLPLLHFLINLLVKEEQTWMLPSISHYYYSPMNVLFTGFMITFGVFLIAYKGHKRKKEEKLSDNWVTTVGGYGAILTAFIPAAKRIWMIEAPNQHCDNTIGIIHLLCAAGFLICMAIMCICQFTIGLDTYKPGTPEYMKKKKRNIIYRICGWSILVGLLFCVIAINLKWNHSWPAVFYGEAFAVFFFGVAWIIKGEALKKGVLKKLY